jgi:hypothetical protein
MIFILVGNWYKTEFLSTAHNFLLVITARILMNIIEIEQENLETDSDEAVSSGSENELDEDTVAAGGDNNATGSRNKIW